MGGRRLVGDPEPVAGYPVLFADGELSGQYTAEKRAGRRAFQVGRQCGGLRRLLVHGAGRGHLAADRFDRAFDRSP